MGKTFGYGDGRDFNEALDIFGKKVKITDESYDYLSSELADGAKLLIGRDDGEMVGCALIKNWFKDQVDDISLHIMYASTKYDDPEIESNLIRMAAWCGVTEGKTRVYHYKMEYLGENSPYEIVSVNDAYDDAGVDKPEVKSEELTNKREGISSVGFVYDPSGDELEF